MDLRESSREHERAPFLIQDKELASSSTTTQEAHWNTSSPSTTSLLIQIILKIYNQRPQTQVLKFLSFFIPSFLRRSTASKDLHETAYLDGLRGYACYVVFISHYTAAYCNEVWHPYGEGGNAHFVQTGYIFQLPIFRLIYNGQAAVSIFFVLSGYVLSYKPLKLIHARDFEKLQSSLASGIFRRWFRLFLPVAALFAINVFLVQFGAFSWFDTYRVGHPKMPPGTVEQYLPAGETFWGTAYNAAESFAKFTNATWFRWMNNGLVPNVDGHTWTLHVEYRCSCVLFLFLHGCSRMHANLRLAFFITTAVFSLSVGEWSLGTFLAGSAIADLDLRIRRRQSQNHENEDEIPLSRDISPRIRTLFRESQYRYAALFIISLFILSYPSQGAEKIPVYRTLAHYRPHTAWAMYFWEAVGGIMIVYTISRFRLVQRVLEWRVSQYMGKTSFALYLCHGTVIKTLGHWSVIHMWDVTGFKGWGYAWGILVPILWVFPTTILVTDWFWRGVDLPSVRFARWFEGLVTEK